MNTKKLILQLDYYDDKIKQKCMQKVSGLPGIELVAIDSKEKKLTVVGEVDPVSVVHKLRKLCRTDIISIGPAKEPEKKKDDSKKDDGKKDDGKKAGDEKKGGGGDEKKSGNGGGDGKKSGNGGGDGKKGGGDSKGDSAVKVFPALPPLPGYPQYHHPQYPQYPAPVYQQFPYQRYPAPAYYHRGAEEDPNSCVIC